MGDYTLSNLTSTSNATLVSSNDQGLTDNMLGNLTGGGGGTDNVTEYKSPFVVTSYFSNTALALLAATGVGIEALPNLWTWRVPYDYSVVEFSVISNERTTLHDVNHFWTMTLQTAEDRVFTGGDLISYGSATVINASNKAVYNTSSLPSNITVSSRPYIRVNFVKTGSPAVDLQIMLKFKMAHVG